MPFISCPVRLTTPGRIPGNVMTTWVDALIDPGFILAAIHRGDVCVLLTNGGQMEVDSASAPDCRGHEWLVTSALVITPGKTSPEWVEASLRRDAVRWMRANGNFTSVFFDGAASMCIRMELASAKRLICGPMIA